jgi:hypothetical protein
VDLVLAEQRMEELREQKKAVFNLKRLKQQ